MKIYNDICPNKIDINQNEYKELQIFSYTANIEIQPVVAFWGGIVTNEVIISLGKYVPINQFLFF